MSNKNLDQLQRRKKGFSSKLFFYILNNERSNQMYKLNWNDEEKIFTVANCDETEGGGKSNIVGENDGMTPACVNNSQVANLMCWNANIKVAEGSVVVVKCRECGLYFLVTKTDVEWYENKGLDAPKRCMCCRKARARKEHYLEMRKENETDNN